MALATEHRRRPSSIGGLLLALVVAASCSGLGVGGDRRAGSFAQVDPDEGDASRFRLADLPLANVRGQPRASLGLTQTEETVHVHRLAARGDLLVAVGSTERMTLGSWPAVWQLSDSGGGATTAERIGPAPDEYPSDLVGSAVDATVMADGSLTILGWLADRSGPRTVLWHRSTDGVTSELAQFDPAELGGDPDRVVVDASGRIWVVARRSGVDGWLAVATEIDGEWRVERVATGLTTRVHAVASLDGVDVIALHTGIGEDLGWVHWNVSADGSRIVTGESERWPATIGITDADGVDDTLALLVATADATVELWTQTASGGWESTTIPTNTGEAPLGLAGVGDERVVLLIGAENDDDESVARAVRMVDGEAQPWSGGFLIDFQTGSDTSDYPLATWRGVPVALDRSVRGDVSAITLDAERATRSNLLLGPLAPGSVERVEHLQVTEDGLVAVLSHVDSDGGREYLAAPHRVLLLDGGAWSEVGRMTIDTTTSWRGAPLFVVSTPTGVDLLTVRGGVIAPAGRIDGVSDVFDMVVHGDQFVLSALAGNRRLPVVGTIGGDSTHVTGVRLGSTVAEVCDTHDGAALIVIESTSTGDLSLATITDGVVDETTEVLRDTGGDGAPLCWKDDGGRIVVATDGGEPGLATVPVLATTGPGDAATELIVPRRARTGTQLLDISTTRSGEYLVGRGPDRWGSWDAAVVRWTGGDLEPVAMFPGNARQEARTILRVADGWLVGGADNGDPVIWTVAD